MGIRGAVYDPPAPNYPYVAVVINDATNEVVVARSVPSPAQGEAMIAMVFEQFAADKAAGKI